MDLEREDLRGDVRMGIGAVVVFVTPSPAIDDFEDDFTVIEDVVG